jgi:hypothetical protein
MSRPQPIGGLTVARARYSREPIIVFIFGRQWITLEFLWDYVHLIPVANNQVRKDRGPGSRAPDWAA